PEAGREFPIYAGSTTIGRDPSNTIVSTGSGVSRKHAQFNIDNNVATVQDLGSANGTFVNDIRISSPHVLAPGDSIRLGQSVEMQYAAPVVTGPAATIVESGASPAPPARSGGATVVRQAPRDAAATMLGDIGDVSAAAGPPTLVVETAGGKSQTYTLTAEHYTIGRADDNDIVVDSKIVSRHHARLHRSASGYQLEQLPDVGNQIYVQGRSIPGLHNLEHGEVFRIGGVDPGTMVTFRYASPATAAQSVAAVDIQFGERMLLQIGRDASNDIRLDVPHVSRYHAQIERVGQRYRVRDLRSSNGTFVNGNRITAETWLKPNDEIRVGPYRFVLGDERLAQYDESSGLRVDAVGLNKWVRKDLNILQDISLVFKPREFIVVVGQSGGGKSTLVDAIAGYRPATHGRVLVNGINVYENFDAIRNEIGFVPQKDIIHMELTVFQALDYAAQLRMPSDTGKKERHARVLEVLRDLDLEHRKDVQISGLSGGQQKRVSIGVELLTKPGLFFLDEPTSGLDPGTETALMQLMRHLADQGRTIVLITHATKNVMLADKVVFLARGGYLTWFGPPDEALQYFNQYRSERDQRAGEMEFDGIYAILDDPSKGSPKEWAQRYKEYTAYQNYVVQPLQQGGQSLGASAAVGAPRAKRARRVSSLRQLAILSARNIKILTRDRFSLTLMLAAAPLVGL
ncbi:MAG: FHA domain-containing protein, partial [Anaerolineales bacterium]